MVKLSARMARVIFACCAVLLILQVTLRIMTMTPWEDEGFFGDPAFTLLHFGYLGTRSVDPASAWQSPYQWFHADRFFYYLPPLYELMVSAWWKLVGSGIFTMRALSGFAGALICLASFGLTRRFSALALAPWLTAIYLVTNYHLITAAATGRQDCSATALGLAGLWAYLAQMDRYRETAGLVIGHSLIAAAMMTHPNGVLYFVPLLYLMWRRGSFLFWRLAMSAMPYLIALGAWGFYISHDLEAFRLQFGTNLAIHGVSKGFAVFTKIVDELGRYYILPNDETTGRAKVVLTIPMLLGAGVLLFNKKLVTAHRDLAVIVAYFMLAMTFIIGRKWDGYLVNILPVYAITIGVVAAAFSAKRWAQFAFLLTCLLGLISTIRIISMQRYQHEYAPVISYISSLPPEERDRVTAAAEFGFGLGFDHVLDDYSLGYVSHEHTKTVIVGEWYEAQDQSAAISNPKLHQHIAGTLSNYLLVFRAGQYKVYVLKKS